MEDDHDQLHALTVFSTAVSMLCHNIGARGLGEEGGGEPGGGRGKNERQSSVKRSGMLVILLSGVNYEIWPHLF